MKVTFLGASQNVTGSRFLLETEFSRILIDCGLFQERDLRDRNWEKFPVDPKSISHLLLTHAHIDHCGYLPRFVKDGFQGKIICTPPTADIAKISLIDTAHIQESDAAYKKKRHKKEKRKGRHPEVPLFTEVDTFRVFSHFRTHDYEVTFDVTKDIKATYYDSGHILGAASIELKIKEGGKEIICIFSGDIGRWDRPILNDPHLFKQADYVFMEATYGNRVHEDAIASIDKLEQVINATDKSGGNVVVPTFSIGRAQELLYDLNILVKEKRIPQLMTFVDSPMAMKITEVFRRYSQYFDEEAQEFLDQYESLFDFPLLKFTKTSDESKAINHIKGTAVILAGSGMCTGGRVKHHLLNNISRPESTVLFVGYQAQGTLGRQILERPEKVRILGKRVDVLSKIEKINGLSAHADKNELAQWLKSFKPPAKKVFIIHSEKEAAEGFVNAVKEEISTDFHIPKYLEEVEIG